MKNAEASQPLRKWDPCVCSTLWYKTERILGCAMPRMDGCIWMMPVCCSQGSIQIPRGGMYALGYHQDFILDPPNPVDIPTIRCNFDAVERELILADDIEATDHRNTFTVGLGSQLTFVYLGVLIWIWTSCRGDGTDKLAVWCIWSSMTLLL